MNTKAQFELKISERQQQEASEVLAQLTAILESAKPQESPELLKLSHKKAELQARFQELESGARLESVEEAAAETSSLREQIRLIELRTEEFEEVANGESAAKSAAMHRLRRRAVAVLCDVAFSFREQHKARVISFLAQYSHGHAGAARNLTGLLPWFSVYHLRINHLRLDVSEQPNSELISYLAAALRGIDFLAPLPLRGESSGQVRGAVSSEPATET